MNTAHWHAVQPAHIWAFIALTLCLILPAGAGDPVNGRRLSVTHCTRCHIVPDHDSMSIGMTPSFQIMVESNEEYFAAFSTFYALRPHPAFVRVEGIPPLNDLPSPIAPIHLTQQEVDDIAAFARSIEKE